MDLRRTCRTDILIEWCLIRSSSNTQRVGNGRTGERRMYLCGGGGLLRSPIVGRMSLRRPPMTISPPRAPFSLFPLAWQAVRRQQHRGSFGSCCCCCCFCRFVDFVVASRAAYNDDRNVDIVSWRDDTCARRARSKARGSQLTLEARQQLRHCKRTPCKENAIASHRVRNLCGSDLPQFHELIAALSCD
jgi:hypothetical protein